MTPSRSPELLAWGAFLTVVATAAMLWVGVPYGGVTSASALLLFAFALSWALTPPRTTTAAAMAATLPAALPATAPVRTAAVSTPAKPAAPAANAPSSAAVLRPAGTHPAVRNRTAPHGRRAAVAPVFHEMPAEPSRWTRTFGPPDTGQIPLQPYVSGVPASYATADAGLPDRRQRSHSTL